MCIRDRQILDLPQRKRIADVHHHREADYLGRTVKITEGIAHHRRLRNLARWLKPIYSDNAGQIEVAAIDPAISMAQVGNPALKTIAEAVTGKLQQVVAAI